MAGGGQLTKAIGRAETDYPPNRGNRANRAARCSVSHPRTSVQLRSLKLAAVYTIRTAEEKWRASKSPVNFHKLDF